VKIGLLSDAHGNVEAFRAGLGALTHSGAAEFFFLGDAVGYIPGDAVVDELRSSSICAIRGNHETMLLADQPLAERDRVYKLAATARVMKPENRSFIETWPAQLRIAAPCGELLLVHGSPADVTFGYVYEDSDLSAFGVPDGITVFMANTHRPFIRKLGEALFINIGSCGLPRDNGVLGAACLFDTDTRAARIIRFDIHDAVSLALARHPSIAEEVRAVFDRRESVREWEFPCG
jgi:predicted phosphodiesterase